MTLDGWQVGYADTVELVSSREPTDREVFEGRYTLSNWSYTLRLENVTGDLNPYIKYGESRSLLIEWTEEVPDDPPYPELRGGLWAWLTRYNKRALNRYHAERSQWFREGRPTRPERRRMYTPHVRFTGVHTDPIAGVAYEFEVPDGRWH